MKVWGSSPPAVSLSVWSPGCPTGPCAFVMQRVVHGLLPCAGAPAPPELNLHLVLQLHPELPALNIFFNIYLTNICRESNTAGCKQPRALLEHVEDNFLIQVLGEPSRGKVFLDLVLTNAEELIKGVQIGGSLGCSDHSLMEFVRIVSLARS